MHRLGSILLSAALLASVGCIHIYEPRPADSPSRSASKASKESDKDKKKDKPPFKPWKDVTKDTKATEGLVTLHHKRDNTLMLELAPAMLDRDFGLMMHYSRGLGVYNVHDGLVVSGTRMVRFTRVGDTMYLVHRNPRFTADEGTPIRLSVEENTGHSVIAALKILSEKKEDGPVLVDVTPFLVSDYAGLGERLKRSHGGKPVGFDKSRSYVDRVQGFPGNMEIDVLLTFKPASSGGGVGVSDTRSVPIGLRYSLFALPETPMAPRLADDRVGHFLTAVEDFSRDRAETRYVRWANRWRLEKKDPAAAVSEPVKPIVYWVDRTVPKEYRQYVREGIEAWNRAFEAAGFKNAVVAKIAPDDDPAWSAEDMRYSTVRWTAAHSMGYAIGPSQVDPRSGEILNADILISSNFVRGWQFDWQEMAPADVARLLVDGEILPEGFDAEDAAALCTAEVGKSWQLGVQYAAMATLGRIEPGRDMPEFYLGDAIRDLVMHEVGHTLGLRHNFKASSAIPFEKLHDKSFTGTHGVAVSVMDYNPVNISANPDRQGDYWSRVVGDYDIWAISYAYSTPLDDPAAEKARLRALASRGTDEMLTYGSDEDNFGGPFAVDPRIVTWDLGSDPLAYAKERAALVKRVLPELEERLIREGDGFQRLRSAYPSLMVERARALTPAIRIIGGLHVARDHKGDPNGRMPFTPVSAERQREALSLVAREALAENAWTIDPEMLNKLAPNRWMHWGLNLQLDPTFPIHAWVSSSQGAVLSQLLSPPRLGRILDNELRVGKGRDVFSMDEVFAAVDDAVWAELGGVDGRRNGSPRPVSSFRRSLQRQHVGMLTALLLGTDSPMVRIPEDARSMARYSLGAIATRIRAVESYSSLDRTTRAHLDETATRIERALEASLALSYERKGF